jgi:hypothetical protein
MMGEDKNLSAAKLRQLGATEYNKIRVGSRTLSDDVTIDRDMLKFYGSNKITKEKVQKALEQGDLPYLRRVSDTYYRRSGIYSRLCRYMAYLFRYDWMITPVVGWNKKVKDEKVIEGWLRGCKYLENSRFKKACGDIALKVMIQGVYYGYRLDKSDSTFLQELPVSFCRSRYSWNGWPAVELNVKYFDEAFSDAAYRAKVLRMYPKEIQKAYLAYKQERLEPDFASDDKGWVLLDPEKTVKFNLGNSDFPMFASVIPHLMDLEAAQAIDNKKMEQQILKIIIQKFPMGKNDDPIFDVDQMNALHASAVQMLGDAIGVDVLSTLADVDVADMSDKGNTSSVDQLEKVERTVYNEAGVSQLQFNSDGSVALEKSIVNDEASLRNLVDQFQEYGNRLLAPLNKNKAIQYHVDILSTTAYNYKDLSKLYKEQTTLGYSKLLPQVALGQAPSCVIMNSLFENKMLKLDDVFIPPATSNTMSGNGGNATNEARKAQAEANKTDTQTTSDGETVDTNQTSDETGGRPSIADEDKSATTLKNKGETG